MDTQAQEHKTLVKTIKTLLTDDLGFPEEAIKPFLDGKLLSIRGKDTEELVGTIYQVWDNGYIGFFVDAPEEKEE